MTPIPYEPGSYVYGRTGVYVGYVEAADADCIKVRGPLPAEPLYEIPAKAVAQELGGGRELFLECTIDEMVSRGWLVATRQAARKTLSPGSFVYDSAGAYVGRVEAVNESLLRVRGPLPEEQVFYLPLDAVSGELPGGREIFLAFTLDEVRARGWLHPPHGSRLPASG